MHFFFFKSSLFGDFFEYNDQDEHQLRVSAVYETDGETKVLKYNQAVLKYLINSHFI